MFFPVLNMEGAVLLRDSFITGFMETSEQGRSLFPYAAVFRYPGVVPKPLVVSPFCFSRECSMREERKCLLGMYDLNEYERASPPDAGSEAAAAAAPSTALSKGRRGGEMAQEGKRGRFSSGKCLSPSSRLSTAYPPSPTVSSSISSFIRLLNAAAAAVAGGNSYTFFHLPSFSEILRLFH